jgi:hypothetical protein
MLLMSPPNRLLNFTNATTLQLRTFEEIEERLRDRFLNAKIDLDILIVDYRTKSGYFVRAYYNKRGEWIKKAFYKGYDSTHKEPLQIISIKTK